MDAIRSAWYGPIAGANPWDAATLEWATSSPPPSYNFAHIPVVGSANPLWDDREALPVAAGLEAARRELIVSSVAEARPEARESSPQNSIWPLLTAVATTMMLISSIFTPWAVIWGSIPVAASFERILGLPVVLLGFAPPDAHAHAPNEYMDLRNYETGIRTLVRFFDELRDTPLR